MTMVKLMYYFCFGLLWRFRGIDHLKWLISLQQKQTQSRKKSLLLFIVVKYMYNNNQEFSFVAQCGHLRCISWRFDCILLVFISRWRRLLTHRPFEQDASQWFVDFQQLWLVFAVSVSCSLGGRCRTRVPSVVVLLDRGHPWFRNFYSTIPVDVVKMKSYLNRLFDPACAPSSSKNT